MGPPRLGQEPPMSNEAVSPLRRRMIDDMTIRHFVAKTQADYIRTVRTFAAFLGQSPDQAEPEDLRRFQLHMAAQGASPTKMNAAVSALLFFFNVTLGRRSEEHTSELQYANISYAVFCLKKKN